MKVALGLAELFRVGYVAYAAYLVHKKLLLPVAEGYFGNKKLLELDQQKEQVLLDNILEAISTTAKEQHKSAGSKGVTPDNPEKIIERVAALVTAHIVRGNDVKILALPTPNGEPAGSAAKPTNLEAEELSKASAKARNALKELPPGQLTLLLQQYGEPEVTDESDDGKQARVNKRKAK